MNPSKSQLSGLTSWIISKLSLPIRTRGESSEEFRSMLRSMADQAPEGFQMSRVCRAALPKDFSPFTKAEIEEARQLYGLIREDNQAVHENSYDVFKARHKHDDPRENDLPMAIRLEVAGAVKAQAKARIREHRKRLEEILRPGLVQLADQLESAAEEYAAAEQAAATSMGLRWDPSCIVRAAAHAAHWIRQNAHLGANARDLSEASHGLLAE